MAAGEGQGGVRNEEEKKVKKRKNRKKGAYTVSWLAAFPTETH